MKIKNLDEYKEFAKTHSRQECADKYGVSASYLYHFNRKNGVKSFSNGKRGAKPRYSFNETEDECREFLKTHTIRDIIQKYNVSYFTVINWARKLNVKTMRVRPYSDRDSMITSLVNDGYTYQNIADVFGMSKQRVEQIVNR